MPYRVVELKALHHHRCRPRLKHRAKAILNPWDGPLSPRPCDPSLVCGDSADVRTVRFASQFPRDSYAFLSSIPSGFCAVAPCRPLGCVPLERLDRKRKKRMSNEQWMSPTDGGAGIAKMKRERTCHKAEHGVELDTDAVVALTLEGADQGDATTLDATSNERVYSHHQDACT